MAQLAGLLLAGGRSSRFGSDKALAVVEGMTLLERAATCLRAACDGPVLVASGDGRSRPGIADGQVADLVVDAGPLSAIGAGLAACSDVAPHVAVLAVDHVSPSDDLLRLLAARPGQWSVALSEVGGHRQPLQAIWSTSVASDVAVAVHGGTRSVLRWLDGRDDVAVIGAQELVRAGIQPSVIRDVDRPSDVPPTSGAPDS